MYRDREEPDETEEISLEDTQEYSVVRARDADAETRALRRPDPETDEYDEEEFDDGVVDDYIDEGVVDEDEAEDEYFVDEIEDVDEEVDVVDLETEEADLPEAKNDEPTDSVSTHLKAAGSVAVAKVRGVKLPKPPKPNVNKPEGGVVAGVAAIVIASLIVGVGAYFLGKGTGDDVDTARLEGAAAGKQAGAIEGASKGYAEGFQKGRDAGFEKAYIPAYKLHYKRAFEQAGLDAPKDEDIDVPAP